MTKQSGKSTQSGGGSKPVTPNPEEKEAQTGKGASGLGEDEPVGPWTEEEAVNDEANFADEMTEEEVDEKLTYDEPMGAAAPGSKGAQEDTKRAAQEASHEAKPGEKSAPKK
jgi:hypothetical protein